MEQEITMEQVAQYRQAMVEAAQQMEWVSKEAMQEAIAQIQEVDEEVIMGLIEKGYSPSYMVEISNM